MSDRDRALAYLAGLVAVFVLAVLVGRVVGPAPQEPPSEHDPHAAVTGP